ncbi:OsmC family peroxiredoxin [Undibacterium sp. SXout11W]|uniref:OsmC family peroxiredoxin n=1 Tax=Undibacterium sp. SXout11W TaxID=3413050 RepID=UPI003BEF585A
MSEKTASIHWEGAGKTGQGKVSTETGALNDYPYGYSSRFEDNRTGTNPEELLAAAHAACFTMAFAFVCERADLKPSSIDTNATVRLIKKDEGLIIDQITLTMHSIIPGLGDEKFQELALVAKRDCPLSKALASVPNIILNARLG